MELIVLPVCIALAIIHALEAIGAKWRATLGGIALLAILVAGILRSTDASPSVAIPQSAQSGPAAARAGR